MSFDANTYDDWEEYINTLRKYKFDMGYKPKHQILFDYYYHGQQ